MSFSRDLDETALTRQEAFDGKPILLTSVRELSSAEVVTRYKRLAEIERCFRVLKQTSPSRQSITDCLNAFARMRCLHSGATAAPSHAFEAYRLQPGRRLAQTQGIQLHRFNAAAKTISGLTATSDETRSIFQQLDLPLPDQKSLGA